MKKIIVICIGLLIIFSIGLYLLNQDLYQLNPYQTPDTHATLEAVKVLPSRDYIRTYQENQQACVDVFARAFQINDVYNMDFEVTINNSAVGRAYTVQSITALFDPTWTVCIDISRLPVGEHLAELRFRPNPESDSISYQWVIKIAPTNTS